MNKDDLAEWRRESGLGESGLGSVKKVNQAVADDPFTEDALALRFSERHADDLRYIATKGQWQKWHGTRWRGEETYLAFELARQSCREDAKTYGNGKAPSLLYTKKTVAAVEFMAKADRRQATTIDQWDANDWILNAENATLDLKTGAGYLHRPDDYSTKITSCGTADDGTPTPLWDAFLERVAPDPELRAFLKRWCGYCLTGSTSEHKFVFAYGTGANGKSTFTNTIAAILGDYSTIADVGTFIASRSERHPTDVAKLHGFRLVVAQETEKGRQWDESKIKTMTGGDKITARFMHCNFFDFIPKFKLFITGNHKPSLDNVDEAMRRRLLLVPFMVQIPVEERDPDLLDKLKTERPAILRWMLDGCLEWQRIGLAPPKIITEATAMYFDDQDFTNQWLEERTESDLPTAFISTSQLFASWKGWCDQRGFTAGSSKVLAQNLIDRGLNQKRIRTGHRGFAGIRLRAIGDTDDI
jgi:putative DNA primase/helicase